MSGLSRLPVIIFMLQSKNNNVTYYQVSERSSLYGNNIKSPASYGIVMGQGISTDLNSVNPELTNEMDERLLDKRIQLMSAVQNNLDTSEAVIGLLSVPCPVSLKYGVLDIRALISSNNKTVDDLKKIPVGLGILEKYGRHLLKPNSKRAEMWRSVKFSNPIYKERVSPLEGSKKIMALMGYTISDNDGVYFPEGGEPDQTRTLNLVCDIIMAKTELELYLQGNHPRSSDIEQFLYSSTVVTHTPCSVRDGGNSSLQKRSLEVQEIQTITDQGSPQMCEICLNQAACVYCETCSNKMMCQTCDDNWHQHPRRQHDKDKRKKLNGNNIPVLQRQSKIDHQGAYGISEVIQRAPNSYSAMKVTEMNISPTQHSNGELSVEGEVQSKTDENTNNFQQRKLVTANNSGVEPQTYNTNLQTPSSQVEAELRKHQVKIQSYSGQSFSQNSVPSNYKQTSFSRDPMTNQFPRSSGREEKSSRKSPDKKSKLLAKIIAIPDINIQKSKCEINIAVIDDEVSQLDKDLNEILAQDDQFIHNEMFISLNKKKSALIKEMNILKDYVEELENREQLNIPAFTSTTQGMKDNPKETLPKTCSWECQHCTYINEKDTEVCDVCNKTTKRMKDDNRLKGIHIEDKGMMVNRENVGCRFNELQDQVYLEKMEAQNSYKQRASELEPNTFVLNAEKENMNLNIDNHGDVGGVNSNVIGSHTHSDVSGVNSTVTGSHNHGDVGGMNSNVIGSHIHGDVGGVNSNVIGSHNHGDVAGVNSNFIGSLNHGDVGGTNGNLTGFHTLVPDEFMKTVDKSSGKLDHLSFQERMKQNAVVREQKQMEENGFQLLNVLKIADQFGYDIEELEIVVNQFSVPTKDVSIKDVLKWFEETWQNLLESVKEEAKQKSASLINDDMGEITSAEARNALIRNKGNVEKAVDDCINNRQCIYTEINGDEKIENHIMMEAIQKGQGDMETVQDALNQILLKPFLERLWCDEGNHDLQDARFNSVSTSITETEIFQNNINNSNIDRQRRIRMVWIEGKLKSWGRAETVIKIIDQELQKGDFSMASVVDIIEAVRNCGDLKTSIAYLQQECGICFSLFPMNKITSLVCQCKLCVECITSHFQHCVKDMNVKRWSCPVCSGPNMADPDVVQNYLGFIKLVINNYCDHQTQDLFDQKANLWNIQQDPNFRWCAHCETGFIFNGRTLCMTCDNCGKQTCFECKIEWETQHQGLTCEEFKQWKYDNDPNNQAIGLAKHLEENGIDCPSCKMRYALSKGGCMHFTCPQCSHEFCSGCYQPFYHQNTCPNKCSGKKGLHCHHPRDCFFYLRDEDTKILQQLLQMHDKDFDQGMKDGQETCPVMEQKERASSGNYDEACGKEVEEGSAGLCLNHYKEYLVGLINKYKLDPLDVIKDLPQLKAIALRLHIKIDDKKLDIQRLKQKICEKEPLERSHRR